ncbi:hypothetical protein S40288_04807 [Stachybotrys chartarum IBT 40288]|nr:hypothetical protein S40288_04807 [Stachybotrys chartarum IBT 40288]
MVSLSSDRTGPSSPMTPVTPRQDTASTRASAPLTLELPTLPELSLHFLPPTPEEKIAYDPSARQLLGKDGLTLHGSSPITYKNDRNEQRTVDSKPLPIEPVDMSSPRSGTVSPLQKPPSNWAGLSPTEPHAIDHSLPEVVTPEIQAELERREALRREQSLRSLKPEASRPYTPHAEAMAISPANFDTVTPLHLLGDQPDVIDCPFCLRRSETKVIKEASALTHALAGLCCMTTIFGVFAPYMLDWSSHIDQQCANCNRKVTRRYRGKGETIVFGTPLHLREVSRYPAAEFHLNEGSAPPPPAKAWVRDDQSTPTPI